MDVRLLTEQCLQRKLQRSVTMMVPNIGFFRRNNTVVSPKRENSNKVDAFICLELNEKDTTSKGKIDESGTLWHISSMARWAYILHLAHQLLWPRRGAQRIVASVCITGIALGLMLQIVVRGVMDGMVREIDAGVHACMPDLLLTSRSGTLPDTLSLPSICTATPCQAGIAATPHGLSRYITWHNPELIAPLITSGQGKLKPGNALISQSLADKAKLKPGDTLPIQFPGNTQIFSIQGIYRVPGRMLVPDILLPHSLDAGTPALAINLAEKRHIGTIIQNLQKSTSEVEIHPTHADTAAWLSIIQRTKQTMGFILYLCTALAAFACGALLWVICLQRRQELSIIAAFGLPPGRIRAIILCMAGSVAASGIALGLPLAWATLHWREEIRQLLADIGIQAFPVEILDMPLPAHTKPELYLTHTLFTLAFVLLSSLPAQRLIRRLSSQAPQQ